MEIAVVRVYLKRENADDMRYRDNLCIFAEGIIYINTQKCSFQYRILI